MPLLLLMACQKGPTDLDSSASEPMGPEIELSTYALDFGEVERGGSAELFLRISNVGDAPLVLEDAILSGASEDFEASGDIEGRVAPGESLAVMLRYTPSQTGSPEGRLTVATNDRDESIVTVQLLGESHGAWLSLEPREIDFGGPWVGCEDERPVRLSNVGDEALVITSIEESRDSDELGVNLRISANGELPWTLEPGEELRVHVSYAPVDEVRDTQSLLITSNDAQHDTVLATQTGLGVVYEVVTEVFIQPEATGDIDLLFTLDRSSGMEDDIANVTQNLERFVEELDDWSNDYHVALVTSDDGCVAGEARWIDDSMSARERVAALREMMAGPTGGNAERAFMLAEAALSASNTGSGGCNEGLVRDAARLAIVGITDEPEQSVNPYSYYVALFQSMKSDPDDVSIHAIAGDYPSGCGTASAGAGLYEATIATGGYFLSICSAYSAQVLSELGAVEPGQDGHYELSGAPATGEPAVRVDGVLQTEGWSYEAANNAVTFDEDHVPAPGSVIEITYPLYVRCD